MVANENTSHLSLRYFYLLTDKRYSGNQPGPIKLGKTDFNEFKVISPMQTPNPMKKKVLAALITVVMAIWAYCGQ